MRFLVFMSAVLGFSTMAQGIDCVGTFRSVQDDKSVIEETVQLSMGQDTPVMQTLSGDIGDFHFYVQGQKKESDYLMMITLGPDYTRGATGRLTWDKNNRMRITRVDGDDVYKLECNQ
ncbi:MAG: hypothetical protein AAF203_05775 [Pseudomonadota bacterium]